MLTTDIDLLSVIVVVVRMPQSCAQQTCNSWQTGVRGCARVCECPRTVGIVGPLTGQWRILAERCITLLNLTLLRLLASPSRRLQGKGSRWALSRPLRRSKK